MKQQKGAKVPTINRRSKPASAKRSKILQASAAEGEKLTVRLLDSLNEIVRRAALYRGDISKTISEALESVDLTQVKALDLEEAGELMRSTTIVLDSKVLSRLKQSAKTRGSSMNLLINSALAKRFGYSPKQSS